MRKTLLLAGTFALLLAVFGIGFYSGENFGGSLSSISVKNQTPTVSLSPEVDFTPFWHAWALLDEKYVDIEEVKRENMVYSAISGLMKSTGDPYTVFFPPEEHKDFQDEIKGEFEGVGMEIGVRKGTLTVVAPLKGTPADRAGILAGDKILRINGTTTIDLTVEEAVKMIRGPRGSKVKLTVLRNGDDESREIEVERDVIKMPVIETESKKIVINKEGEGPKKEIDIGDDIFLIRLYNFSETSETQFRQALRTMLEGKHKKLILDLRNNPGGFLDSAIRIASWFLPGGEVVVKEDFGKNGGERIHKSKGYYAIRNIPIVILVNQGSASASEILAGALRDHGLATLIGEKTFGKGSVQELVPLTKNTSLKITVAKWLTPKGAQISEKGLDPDIEVKTTKEDLEAKRDPVMERAVEVIKNMKEK